MASVQTGNHRNVLSGLNGETAGYTEVAFRHGGHLRSSGEATGYTGIVFRHEGHLRASGDRSMTLARNWNARGTPPQQRGTPPAWLLASLATGDTSASAGKTASPQYYISFITAPEAQLGRNRRPVSPP